MARKTGRDGSGGGSCFGARMRRRLSRPLVPAISSTALAATPQVSARKRIRWAVGLAVDRWGGDADFQAVAVGTDDFVLTGARLDVYGQQQIRAVPAIPVGFRGDHGVAQAASAPSSGTISRRTTSRARMASSGDKSMPLIGGSRRRTGRSTGSVSVCNRFTAGL